MSITLSKEDLSMIRASGHGLDTAGMQQLEASVISRLEKLLDDGTVTSITRNNVRAAITAELSAGK
jgi:hypothetical protein